MPSYHSPGESASQPEFNPSPLEVLEWGQPIFQHLGLEVDPIGNPAEYRAALKRLDPRYEGGQHLIRYELERDSRRWPEATKKLIDRVAVQMGMLQPEVPLPAEDTELYLGLGGARRANLDRTLWTTDGMAARQSRGTFLGTGSARTLEREERERYAAGYAPDLPKGATETDLLVAAARHARAFHPNLRIGVVPAPAGKLGTAEVVESAIGFYTKYNGGTPPESLTAVTHPIYQLFTLMDVRRAARQHGVERFYVACCPSEQAIIDSRTPSSYLSEILRTLRAALDCYEYEAGLPSSAS